MKFDIEKYAGDYVMHCKTEEEAKDFCKYLDSIGRTWASGGKYVDNLHWSDYGPDTIYWFNSGCYDYVNYYTNATILEWSDFMEEKKEPKCSNKIGVDYSKEIFQLLGISPNEIFKVKSPNEVDYKINEGLGILFLNEKGNWESSQLSLVDFLKGNVTIYKKPIPTEIEQIAINYALAYGCHWIAKDSDGVIYAYKRKPHKSSYSDMWDDDVNDDKLMVEIKLPISFLSWEDDEPYYIGD